MLAAKDRTGVTPAIQKKTKTLHLIFTMRRLPSNKTRLTPWKKQRSIVGQNKMRLTPWNLGFDVEILGDSS
jgi:hypothetical protein